MEWESQALEEAENIALPPVMAYLVKFDAEKRARKKGLSVVTADIVKQTGKGYEKLLGREAVELIKKMGKGEDVDLPDEFFEETTDQLFSVNLCPAKFGACTKEKRDMMLKSLKAIKIKLIEMDITGIMLDKAVCPILSHHALRVAITGCSNCCLTPYFSDIGIVSLFRPCFKSTGCIGCGECVKRCAENAINLDDKMVLIDYEKCLMCGGVQIYVQRELYLQRLKDIRLLPAGQVQDILLLQKQ